MFSQTRDIPMRADSFIDLYKGCTVNCEMCKFNRAGGGITELNINFADYKNQKVLFCYSTEPYALDDFDLVKQSVLKLKANGCSIVFLIRKANCLIKQLDLFDKNDIVGVSVSENSSKNSGVADIIKLFKKAKATGLTTWISLEPVLSADFANKVINDTHEFVDYYRVGKDDLLNYDFEKVKKDIIPPQDSEVFIK